MSNAFLGLGVAFVVMVSIGVSLIRMQQLNSMFGALLVLLGIALTLSGAAGITVLVVDPSYSAFLQKLIDHEIWKDRLDMELLIGIVVAGIMVWGGFEIFQFQDQRAVRGGGRYIISAMILAILFIPPDDARAFRAAVHEAAKPDPMTLVVVSTDKTEINFPPLAPDLQWAVYFEGTRKTGELVSGSKRSNPTPMKNIHIRIRDITKNEWKGKWKKLET